jgi:hypothetical protein
VGGDEDEQWRLRPPERRCDDEPVEARHLDVLEDDVHLVRLQRLERRASRAAFRHHGDVGCVGEQTPQPSPSQRLVVDEQDVHRGRSRSGWPVATVRKVVQGWTGAAR